MRKNRGRIKRKKRKAVCPETRELMVAYHKIYESAKVVAELDLWSESLDEMRDNIKELERQHGKSFNICSARRDHFSLVEQGCYVEESIAA